jgi:hypothetical protein
MSVLIYTEQAGDKLKLLAEVGEDNVELAIDALLDAEPKFESQQPFVVFPGDARMVVEVGEIVRPRRDIKITGGNGAVEAAPKRRGRPAKAKPAEPEAEAEPQAEEEAAAPPKRRGRPPGAKNKPKGKPAAKRSGSPFKRNPASDE